jgi:hypothetical protein
VTRDAAAAEKAAADVHCRMSTPAAEPVQDPTVATPQNKSWFSTVDWLARHEALLHAARERGGRCELVFLGDSITEGWLTDGKGVWNDAYAQYKPVNLGIGGDEVQHLLWRCAGAGP